MNNIQLNTVELNLCELNINNDNALEITNYTFENYSIESYTENNNKYFKLLNLSKALDISITPVNLLKFSSDEIGHKNLLNNKGDKCITDFLTINGVYKFLYATDLHATNDLSEVQASKFKLWIKNIMYLYAVELFKAEVDCSCAKQSQLNLQDKDLTPVEDMRKCRTCKLVKYLDCYECANKNNYKTNCIECVNKLSFVCKKCNIDKLGACYSFSDNNIRQRTCAECIDSKPKVFKLCKKCNKTKETELFGRYSSGDLHSDCTECYKTTSKRDNKKCRKCQLLLTVDKFKVLNSGKRNRLCDTCRG